MSVHGPVLAFVLKGFPRISETFISNEIRLLEQAGVRLHIVSMRAPRESFTHASVREIQAPVSYLPERILGNFWKLLAAALAAARRRPAVFRAALRQALARFRETRKTASLKHLLQAAYVAERILPGSGVTHLHAHFAHSPTSVARYAALLADLPFSFTAHAKDIYTQDPDRLAEKMAAAAFVITCTGHNRDNLLRIGPPGKDVHSIYHGIDTSLFSPNGRGPGATPPYTILTVARFTAKKGLPTVLRALRLLKDSGLDFRFLLVGGGEDKDEVHALVRDLDLAGRTELLGVLPHEKVLDLYRRADLFVLGCKVAKNGDRDGLPNVLVESLAMGVPVAATRVSAIPELVQDGVTGLLADPDDPDGLAKAMRRLLTDQDLRARVIPAGQRKVRERFDNRALAQDLLAVFQAHGAVRGGQ